MHGYSSIAMVDRRGWVLLQERDEHPVIDPEKWGFPGGGVEDGETFEAAAYRELAEETGVELQGGLELFGEFVCRCGMCGDCPFAVYAVSVDLTDDDIDAMLDEIDDVLETNSEDFVRGFVQKGGQ